MTFNELYHTYYRELWRFCLYVSGNVELSNDTVQECFTKLHLAIKQKKMPENIRAWLYTIARNEISTFFSKINRHAAHNELYTKNQETTINPYHSILKKERTRLLLETLEKLPQCDREIISLYQQGFNYTEISEVTGVTKTSVGKTLSRALDKLRNQLKKHCYELFEN